MQEAQYLAHSGPSTLSYETSQTTVRPWIRFWARFIDFQAGGFVIGIALGIVAPDLFYMPDVILGIVVLICWIPIEALLLATIRTTPGKWTLNVSVRSADDEPMTIGRTLKRAFGVWFWGLGLGLPLISAFAQFAGYRALIRDNETSWDRDGKFVTTHGQIGFFRWLLAIAAIIGIFVLIALSY